MYRARCCFSRIWLLSYLTLIWSNDGSFVSTRERSVFCASLFTLYRFALARLVRLFQHTHMLHPTFRGHSLLSRKLARGTSNYGKVPWQMLLSSELICGLLELQMNFNAKANEWCYLRGRWRKPTQSVFCLSHNCDMTMIKCTVLVWASIII